MTLDPLSRLVPPTGIEPATFGTGNLIRAARAGSYSPKTAEFRAVWTWLDQPNPPRSSPDVVRMLSRRGAAWDVLAPSEAELARTETGQQLNAAGQVPCDLTPLGARKLRLPDARCGELVKGWRALMA